MPEPERDDRGAADLDVGIRKRSLNGSTTASPCAGSTSRTMWRAVGLDNHLTSALRASSVCTQPRTRTTDVAVSGVASPALRRCRTPASSIWLATTWATRGAVSVRLFEPVINGRNGIGDGNGGALCSVQQADQRRDSRFVTGRPKGADNGRPHLDALDERHEGAGHVRVFNRAQGLDGREGEVRIIDSAMRTSASTAAPARSRPSDSIA